MGSFASIMAVMGQAEPADSAPHVLTESGTPLGDLLSSMSPKQAPRHMLAPGDKADVELDASKALDVGSWRDRIGSVLPSDSSVLFGAKSVAKALGIEPGTVGYDRIGWGLDNLYRLGIVTRVCRGTYRISSDAPAHKSWAARVLEVMPSDGVVSTADVADILKVSSKSERSRVGHAMWVLCSKGAIHRVSKGHYEMTEK